MAANHLHKPLPTSSAQPPEDEYARPAVLKGLPKSVVLYQYEVCPFCCKAKAGIPGCAGSTADMRGVTGGELLLPTGG